MPAASSRPGARAGQSSSAEATAWKREFGDRLREARKERGWSQERLAEAVGVHRTYAGTVERGEQNVSLTNICELARALGVQPGELMPSLG
jgi:transcriptional regulator with XRE-family HTH domain